MSGKDNKINLIDGKYHLTDLIDAGKLETFFDLFTKASGFTASIILYPEHELFIKAGCHKLCTELQCLDPSCSLDCITDDLLLDSEIREMSDLTLRISGIGLADGALPVYVRGIHVANIISGHVFFEKPDMEKLLKYSGNRNLEEYLRIMGGVQNVPVVKEETLKSSLVLLRDITVLLAEQKINMYYENDIRDSLRKSETLFRGITNSIPGVVYQFYVKPDGAMGLNYVSERSKEIVEIDNNIDNYFQRVCQLIIPEEREKFINSILESVRHFKMWQQEVRIVTPSGIEKCILGISHPEKSGDEIIFNGVLLDVTSRKKAEDSLRESESRYREIFEDSTVGIYQSTPDGRYRIVNRAFAEMGGYESPEQMISGVKDIANELYVNPSERNMVKKLLEEHGYFRNLEIEFKRKDGVRFWGSINSAAIKDSSGKCIYYHGTMIDITDRKKAEDALRRNEERYRMITDFTGQLTYERDLVTNVIHWAGRSADITGFTINELQEMNVKDLIDIIHPDDRVRVRKEYISAKDEHRIFSAEYRFRKKDGSYIHVEDIGTFIYSEDGKAARMIGVVKDITESITASEERLKLERRILYAQKMESLGIMAGGIAHDFNNLLMGIMGSLELAMMNLNTGSDIYRNLQRAMGASKRAADITAQMLAYSGRGHFMMAPVDPVVILAGMSDILRSSVNKTITMNFDIPPILPLMQADAGQFQQVMMNLVSNASEAIGDNAGDIKITAGTERYTAEYLSKNLIDSPLKPGSYVFVEVSDTGCGMNENIQKQMFEPFFSTKQTGRGLGMPAVQGIMKGHNGGLVMESIEGAGTKVKVFFPVIDDEKNKLSGDDKSVSNAYADKSGGVVLVVDDENIVRDLCIDFVKLLGIDAVGAVDGEKGVEYFREHADEINCVLLDLSMPKMDGVTAFHEIKKIRSDVPVVLCSGYSEEDATRSFAGEGLAGFLQKPYRLESLKEKLKSVLKNHKLK